MNPFAPPTIGILIQLVEISNKFCYIRNSANHVLGKVFYEVFKKTEAIHTK